MNIFKNKSMSWKNVFLITILSSVLVTFFNCVPLFEKTSFVAPAETYEVWIVLALFIILNCKGYKEAMMKTFVFFLIGQPLIYLLEVPFKEAGWSLFGYYPFWGMMTILTIPGSLIAYRVKKDDILSGIILSIANFLMIYIGFYWMRYMMDLFPRYVLATLFCFLVPFILIFTILKNKKSRTVSTCLAILSFLICFYTQVLNQQDTVIGYPLDEGNWTVIENVPEGLTVTVESDDLTISTHTNGEYKVVLSDDNGDKQIFTVIVSGSNHYIDIIKE